MISCPPMVHRDAPIVFRTVRTAGRRTSEPSIFRYLRGVLRRFYTTEGFRPSGAIRKGHDVRLEDLLIILQVEASPFPRSTDRWFIMSKAAARTAERGAEQACCRMFPCGVMGPPLSRSRPRLCSPRRGFSNGLTIAPLGSTRSSVLPDDILSTEAANLFKISMCGRTQRIGHSAVSLELLLALPAAPKSRDGQEQGSYT